MKKYLPKFPEVLLVIGHKTATAKTQTYVMFNQKPPESLAVSGLSPLIQFIQCFPFNISEAYFQSYYLPSLQMKSGLISQPFHMHYHLISIYIFKRISFLLLTFTHHTQ